MLRFLSRQKRSRNILLLLFIALMAISLVTFFSVGRGTRSLGSTAVAAKVDGEPITQTEFKERLSLFSPNDPDFRDSSTLLQLKSRGADKTVLDGLIQEKVMEIEARRLGLTTTDDELKEHIRQVFHDDSGSFVGEDKYKRRLAQNNRTWQQFERSLATSITTEKLRNYLTAGIRVSAQEVEDDYKRQNTSADLQYTIVKPSDVRDKVTVSDSELRPYFDAHRKDFYVYGEQRKADYLYVNQSAVSKLVQVSDDELKKRYGSTDQITRARVAQIVLKVLSSKDDKIVREKAADLVKRARGATGTKAEDFATLARGNSQDPKSALKGGDTGWVQRDRNHPDHPLQKAFTLNVGDITDAIKDGNNYYILKVLDKYHQTFEEARPSLLVTAQNDASYRRASQIADEAAEMLKAKKDPKPAADEINKKYPVPGSDQKAVVLEHTPFFADGDQVPGIGSNPGFEDATRSLKKGEVGVKVGVKGGFAIPILADTRGAHEADFDEVKSKVEEALKSEKAKELAEKTARELASKANDPDSLKSATEAMKLRPQISTGFKRGGTLAGLNAPGIADKTAFSLKENEAAKEPIRAGDDWVVLAVKKRIDPDMTKFASERKSTEDGILSARQSSFFQAYIDKQAKELKEQGKVVIYQEVIDDFFSVPEVSGSQNPGSPPPVKRPPKPVKIPTH